MDLTEGFPYGFIQLHREALLIHFIHFMLGRVPRPGGFPRVPSSFSFVGKFSPWFQLYGEALLIHFHPFQRRFLAGLRCGNRRLSFSKDGFGRQPSETV